MSSLEFALHITGSDDLDSTSIKPRLPVSSEAYLKRCAVVAAEGARFDTGNVMQQFDPLSRAIIIEHKTCVQEALLDLASIIRVLRQHEKERRVPIFIILSLLHIEDITSEPFMTMSRLAYSSGVDAICLFGAISSSEVAEVREKALGLRGRRIRIILNDVGKFSDSVQAADGVIAGEGLESYMARDIISRMKLVFTRNQSKAYSLKADGVLAPLEERGTPATTVPSSPLISQVSPTGPRSFLLNEVKKFLITGTRLIIALSEDGDSVRELSAQFRLQASTRLPPPIIGLSASESTCRFMGCFFGVIPLQTQSFVSINTVVMNAIEFAKEQNMVQPGDEVIVVTQPPPVTASTNEMCFEGVVHKRTVS